MSPRTPVTADITGQMVLLGTGTSVGVPVIGCDCPVCRSPDPRNKRLRCAVVLGLPGGNLLIDTPPDLRTQLLREGIGMIHAVAYTHEHADHLFGLDDLRLFSYYLGEKLPLYCDASVERRIRKSYDYAFQEELRGYAGGVPQLRLEAIGDEPLAVLGAWVRPIPLIHGRGRVLGFRFGNVAYCTDTNSIPEPSFPLLEGLDTLVLDCLRPAPHPTHFNVDDAVEAARRIGARRTYFTHMGHELDHATTNAVLPDGIELAYDGLRIPLT